MIKYVLNDFEYMLLCIQPQAPAFEEGTEETWEQLRLRNRNYPIRT